MLISLWHFFTMRCYASMVYAVVMCLSVCLSVCVCCHARYCIKTAKPRITQTMQTIAMGLRVSIPKIAMKFERDHSLRGDKCR